MDKKIVCANCGKELEKRFTSFPDYEIRYGCSCYDELVDDNNNVLELKDEISDLENDKESLEDIISELETYISDLEHKIEKLEEEKNEA
jgi:predicted  nucleic acid-binding Zn-ribbon protein